MTAAREFNRRRQSPLAAVCGAVATGVLWRFLKLEGRRAVVEGPIQSPRKIFGILTAVVLYDPGGYTHALCPFAHITPPGALFTNPKR
jgi:hypothetical protein